METGRELTHLFLHAGKLTIAVVVSLSFNLLRSPVSRGGDLMKCEEVKYFFFSFLLLLTSKNNSCFFFFLKIEILLYSIQLSLELLLLLLNIKLDHIIDGRIVLEDLRESMCA